MSETSRDDIDSSSAGSTAADIMITKRIERTFLNIWIE